MSQLNQLMIDLETLGEVPGAVITSVSAVQFDVSTGQIGEVFEQHILIEDSLREGLFVTQTTLLFWLSQSELARATLVEGQKSALSLKRALLKFSYWVGHYFQEKSPIVWGNGAKFDLGLLQAAYKKINKQLPWNYYDERDLRTLSAYFPEYRKDTPFEGIPHKGVDDCRYQIKYLTKLHHRVITGPAQ